MAKPKKEPKKADPGEALTVQVDAVSPDPVKKTVQKKNSLALPWLLVFFFSLIATGSICAWIEFRLSPATHAAAVTNHKQIFSQNIAQAINTRLIDTTTQTRSIAANADVIAAMQLQDPAIIESLARSIASGFSNIASLQLIPWNLTGTAGLKERNIELRNNIELMLLSKAGANKETQPEAYQHEGKWLVSFSAPIIQGDTVIGVLLLTFNDQYLASILKSSNLPDNAKITINVKNQPILSLGSGNSTEQDGLPLGFTDGFIQIQYSDTAINKLETSFQPVYMALGGVLALLAIMILIGQRMTLQAIRKDTHLIINYADSLGALHNTSHPTLNVSVLSPVLDSIDALGSRTTKTAISSEVRDDYKSPQASAKVPEKMAAPTVAEKNHFDYPEIFRDYDIRGLAESQLNPDAAVMIGKAIGSYAIAAGINTIVMGRDGRVSGERIQYDVSRGILATGCDVINIGQVPSPVLYYATEKLGTGSGIMVTGSHNPPEYNGLKIVINHKTLQGDDLQSLLHRIEDYDFATGQGKISKQEIDQEYIDDVSTDIIIARPLNVVVDAGNGVGGTITTKLLGMLDCQVTELFCDVDGKFPNRGPDPSIRANLQAVISKVQETGADIGIAFDGDADRVVAITSSGRVINGDELLMLFARDIVSRNAGSHIVFDVKCSRNVEKLVSSYGGRAIMTRSGHSNLKATMQETGALLGGEFTGHYYFHERWNGFDDGIYAALRLLELISTGSSSLDEEISSLPQSASTPEFHVKVTNREQAEQVINKMRSTLAMESCTLDNTDGIRAEFEDGWGLIRCSNTSSSLSLRFEGDSDDALARIQGIFATSLNNLNLNLNLPF